MPSAPTTIAAGQQAAPGARPPDGRRVTITGLVRQPMGDRTALMSQGVHGGILEGGCRARRARVQVAALGEYSEAITILDVEFHAALENHRLATPPTACSSGKFACCRCRPAACRVVATRFHVGDPAGRPPRGTHRHAVALAHLGEDLQPGLAQPLEA